MQALNWDCSSSKTSATSSAPPTGIWVRTRVALASTTEGDDKPGKYPQVFAAAEVLVAKKLDLLPYVDYDMAKVRRHALAVNPRPRVFELSCRTGEGLGIWCDWILAHVRVDGR